MKTGDKVWISYCDIDGFEGDDQITCEGKIIRCVPTHNSNFYIVEYKNEYYPYQMIQEKFSQGFLTEIENTFSTSKENDPFRTDAEADADVLKSAGMGTDEDYGGDVERL